MNKLNLKKIQLNAVLELIAPFQARTKPLLARLLTFPKSFSLIQKLIEFA